MIDNGGSRAIEVFVGKSCIMNEWRRFPWLHSANTIFFLENAAALKL
jgi:hypothetical protein